jgi:uracil-DNA glycosylase family 4
VTFGIDDRESAVVIASVAAQVAACRRCDELVAGRTHVVPGQFPVSARLLLLGEAPGADEDVSGEPFVGRSGRLLDELLAHAGMARADVAVANVVKCRPPANRPPRRSEIEACRPFLEAQRAAQAPALTVTLGATATQWLFGRGASLTRLRGVVQDVGGRAAMATYHPSAALRFGPRGAPMTALRDDLVLAATWLAQQR